MNVGTTEESPTGRGGPVPKGYRHGTHRLVPPEETLERVGRWMPAFGITRLANVTGLDTIGIPVVMACRPNARSLSVSQGKGTSLAAAKASALMEAVELYHAERPRLPLLLASRNDLRYSHRLIDVERIPWVPSSRFHDDHRLLWVEGRDLLADEGVWLPYELVHFDTTIPWPTGSGCFPVTTNGLASGNHPVEATLHALCELIERHDASAWQAAGEDQRAATRVDPASIDHPAAARMVERYRAAGFGLLLWETSSVGVPSFRCRIVDLEPDPLRMLPAAIGMGCHPCREIALLRALAEPAQCRLTHISGARDDRPRSRYELASHRERREGVRRRLDEPATRRFGDAPTVEHDDLGADLEWVLERAAAAGVDRVVVIDLSLEGFGVAVSRVVASGLRPMPDAGAFVPRPIGGQAETGDPDERRDAPAEAAPGDPPEESR